MCIEERQLKYLLVPVILYSASSLKWENFSFLILILWRQTVGAKSLVNFVKRTGECMNSTLNRE